LGMGERRAMREEPLVVDESGRHGDARADESASGSETGARQAKPEQMYAAAAPPPAARPLARPSRPGTSAAVSGWATTRLSPGLAKTARRSASKSPRPGVPASTTSRGSAVPKSRAQRSRGSAVGYRSRIAPAPAKTSSARRRYRSSPVKTERRRRF